MAEAITIQVDDKKFKAALKEFSKKVVNPKPFLEGIQARMFFDVQDHFTKEQSPQGRWKGLNAKTLIARAKKRGRASAGILKDSGLLRNSLSARKGSGSISKVTKEEATIGTNLKYAATHNFGDQKRNIAKREYMWMSDKAVNDMTKILLDGLTKPFE